MQKKSIATLIIFKRSSSKKIAVFSTDKPEKHVVYNKLHILDTEGKTLSSFGINDGDYTMWDNDSENIPILGDCRECRDQILTNINISTGKVTSFEAKDFISPLYIQSGDITYIGGAKKESYADSLN